MVSIWKLVGPDDRKPTVLACLLTFVFIVLFGASYFFPIVNACSLRPSSLFELQFQRLLSYPLVHLSILHILFNVLSLFPLLNQFERKNGTVRTYILLVLVTVTTGILYCVVGKYLYPSQAVAGASGVFFTLFTYFSIKESRDHPGYPIFGSMVIPIQYMPIVMILFIALVLPNSSFWGHFFGMLVGFVLAKQEKVIARLIPGRLIVSVEDKLSFLIDKLSRLVKYVKETDREPTDEYVSLLGQTSDGEEHRADESGGHFSGQGRVLGTV